MRSVLRQRDLPPYAHGLAASVARPLTVALGLGTALIAGPSAKKSQLHDATKVEQSGLLAVLTIVRSAEKSILSIRRARNTAKTVHREHIVRRTARRPKNGTRKIIIMSCGHRRGQKVCVICGKPISPGTPRITCSEECDRLRIKWHQERTQIRQGTRKAPTTVNRLDKDFMAQRKKKREEK